MKSNADTGRHTSSCPFTSFVTLFPHIAFINEEAIGYINEEAKGVVNEAAICVINKAAIGAIIAPKKPPYFISFVVLFQILQFQLHHQLIGQIFFNESTILIIP